jgi:hypothetical protein
MHPALRAERALGALPVGAGLVIEGPFGMLMRRADRLVQRRVLLYSNRRPECSRPHSRTRSLTWPPAGE